MLSIHLTFEIQKDFDVKWSESLSETVISNIWRQNAPFCEKILLHANQHWNYHLYKYELILSLIISFNRFIFPLSRENINDTWVLTEIAMHMLSYITLVLVAFSTIGWLIKFKIEYVSSTKRLSIWQHKLKIVRILKHTYLNLIISHTHDIQCCLLFIVFDIIRVNGSAYFCYN